MSIRLRIARVFCLLLHGGHDPLPIASVTHIGLAPGVEAVSDGGGRFCRRCNTRIGDGI